MTQTHKLLPSTLNIEPSAWPLYERLKIGALRNIDIQKETGLLHYSRRFTSIRQALKPFGWDYNIRYCGNKIYEYYLVELREAA
jgi:hypothetical protein